LSNPESHELTAAIFGIPSPICKQRVGAQINKANQNKTVDLYGDNVKTAAGVPVGSFMHIHQAMIHAVGNDLQTGTSPTKQASTFSSEQSAERWRRKNDRPSIFFQTWLSRHKTVQLATS
jgi:hypothetical protein